VLRALVRICGPDFARPAGPADAVAGRPARFVAAPPTAAGVAGLMRLAAEEGLAMLTRGGGTKIDWGVPPARVDLLLDTGWLNGVWHHRPGASTAEVGAGTPLRAVRAALALRRQRLALDPASPGATLGGVLAVNESGPLRHRFGAPDGLVHEYHHVTPDGVARRSSGAAVRDDGGPPAGVLLSAVVDLQPVPEARRWVVSPVSTPLQVHTAIGDTLDADVSPSAVEVDLPAAGPDGQRPGALAVLVEGDSADVAKRAGRLATVLGATTAVEAQAPTWWGRYPFGAEDIALRLTAPVAELHSVVYALHDAAAGAVPVRGSAGAGTVHAVLPGGTPPERVEQILDAVRAVLLGRGGRCVVIAAPPPISDRLDMAAREDLF
jgi:glycolate oxidase FAD binding subunit